MIPTVPEGVVWAILLLPVASMLTIAFVTKPFPKLSGYVTIAAIGTAFLFALWTLDSVIDSDGHALAFGSYHWLSISTDQPAPSADRRPEPDDRRRAAHRRPQRDHARRRDVGVAARADLLAGLHARRRRLLALLRLYVAVHGRDARPADGRQHHHGVRVLGARRPRLVPADRLLVRQEGGRRRREEGVPDDAPRRYRLPARHPADLDEDEHLQHPAVAADGAEPPDHRRRADALRARPLRRRRRQSRRSSRCTSGCPTRWRARRPSRR